MLLARLIVQSKTTHLHLAQSLLGFKFATLYHSFLKNYTVYSFAFCEDTSDEELIAGHIHSGIPRAYPVITKIFSDHHAVIDELVSEYAFENKKFTTHYQPVDLPIIPSHAVHKPLRILWASRITKQKRPDILKAIAQRLDPTQAHIDVYGLFEHGYDHHFLANIPSLTYKGTFSDVRQLEADTYDVFLYTSENDGIPNILLEMISNGLLVVAPKVGGIPELISNETGILIQNNTDIDEYTKAIKDLIANYNETYRPRIETAQKLIAQRHTFDYLVEEVQKDV
jgi:glycosyltransferase involved in cell wall biosynthesis